jgi:hypothetical protein
MSMIRRAEERGDIKPGDTLIEATSGNTGIALAMAAAIKGYRMVLIMPEDLSIERAQTMKAFGAELILTPKSGGMEYARDLAERMQQEGKGLVLDQFANGDNPRIHFETTGPEIWQDTRGKVTHFVSAMGTTGTITGVSRYLKQQNPNVRIVGAQPSEGSRIPGIRKWPQEYLPKIYETAGFRPVARLPWNDDYAPPGWNKETFAKYNNGEPDVVFFVHDPEYFGGAKEVPVVNEYDQAVALQDQALSQLTAKPHGFKKGGAVTSSRRMLETLIGKMPEGQRFDASGLQRFAIPINKRQ